SGGWFFVVASEAISVGDTAIMLPGIGSYIALAIEQRRLTAIYWAIGTMALVILIYDQLLFRPLVAWADRFRPEQQSGPEPPASWVLTVFRRSQLVRRASKPLQRLGNLTSQLVGSWSGRPLPYRRWPMLPQKIGDGIWLAVLLGVAAYALGAVAAFVAPT